MRMAREAFDLNIEKVLESWSVGDAVREFIANALDEHHITGTATPEISGLAPAGSFADFLGVKVVTYLFRAA